MFFKTKHSANLKEVTEIFTSFYFEQKKTPYVCYYPALAALCD